MPIKAGYLFLAGGGLVFFWSGVKGKAVSNVFRDLIGGKNPGTETQQYNIAGVVPTASPTATSTASAGTTGATGAGVIPGTVVTGTGRGAAIAMDALKYNGHKYVYGGPSNPNGGWDCSSFVSYILGHDFGKTLPGGSWAQVTNNGASHGPVAAAYKTWSGATNITRSQVQAGDLLCWETHCGFAADSNHMISAYDTASGTLVTGIDGAGPGGESLQPRRVL